MSHNLLKTTLDKLERAADAAGTSMVGLILNSSEDELKVVVSKKSSDNPEKFLSAY